MVDHLSPRGLPGALLMACALGSTGCGLLGLFPEPSGPGSATSGEGAVVGRVELAPEVTCAACSVVVPGSARRVATDVSGLFVLTPLPAGTQFIDIVTADGRTGQRYAFGVHGGQITSVGTLLAFGAYGEVSGHVSGAAGDAFEEMKVFVAGLPATRPDANGDYLLRDVPPGPAQVILAYRGLRFSAAATVRAGDLTPRVDFAGPWLPPGSVSGRVRGLPRAAAASAVVRLVGTEVVSALNAEGGYLLRGVPAGEHGLELWAPGLSRPLERRVTVGPGPVLDADFDAHAGGGAGAVAGHVLGLDQRFVGTAVVVVVGSPLAATVTPQGTFVLSGVEAGARRLEVRVPDPARPTGRVLASRSVTIPEDDTLVGADLRTLPTPDAGGPDPGMR